jgi:WD40 repeat protein
VPKPPCACHARSTARARSLGLMIASLAAASLLAAPVGACTTLTQRTPTPDPTIQAVGAQHDAQPTLPSPPEPSWVLSPVTVVSQSVIQDIVRHDSGLIAAAYTSGRVDVWDTDTKTLRWTAQIAHPLALHITADAETLVVKARLGDSTSLSFCDLSTGQCQAAAPAPAGDYGESIANGDHLQLISLSSGGKPQRWQLWSMSRRALLLQGEGLSILSPDGEHLVVADQGALSLRATAAPEVARDLSCPLPDIKLASLKRITFSPDSALLLAAEDAIDASPKATLRVCMWSTGADLRPRALALRPRLVDPSAFSSDRWYDTWSIQRVDMSEDGQLLRIDSAISIGPSDYSDSSARAYIVALTPSVVSALTAEDASPPPDTVWVALSQGHNRAYDDADKRQDLNRALADLTGAPAAHAYGVTRLLASANGEWLLTKGRDGFTRWRLPARIDPATPTPAHSHVSETRTYQINGGELLSPDGDALYLSILALLPNDTGGRVMETISDDRADGALLAFDLYGEARALAQAPEMRLQLLTITPDGGHIIGCQSQSSGQKTWDYVLTGDVLSTFERVNLSDGQRQTLPARFTACPPPAAVSAAAMRAVAFGPPADAVVVEGRFRSAALADFLSRNDDDDLSGVDDFSAEDLLDAERNPLRVVDLNTGADLLTLPPDLRAQAVALSPSGEVLALLVRGEARLMLWSVAQGRVIGQASLQGTRRYDGDLTFSADGRALILTSHGHIWALDTARLDRAPVSLGSDPSGKFESVLVRAGDNHLIATTLDGVIWQWDLNDLLALFSASSSSDVPSSP